MSFTARGGWWVAAQMPLLAVAAILPPWSAAEWPLAVRATGWALLAAALLLGVAGARALGHSLTPFPRPLEDAEFCARGPYRFIRHPLYASVLLLAAGWALAWQSAAGLAFVPLLFVFFDLKARREERWLAERYPQYPDYCRRARRFIPGVY